MFTFNEFSDFVVSLKPTIRATVQKYINKVAVDYKADNSPVTLADKEIEAYIVGEIEKKFPGTVIVGEESGTHDHSAEGTETGRVEWVIDPIDGTKSFIHGVPLFATLIAVVVDGKATYGAIYNPVLDDLVTGNGDTALWNGEPIRVRSCESLEKATLLTTNPLNIEKYRNIDNFNDLAHKCWMLRTWGDAYGYFLVATGRADIMIDPIMSRWDLAALIPVIRGAGGVITDYYGNTPENGDSIVAAGSPAIHAAVLKELNK